MVKLVDENCLEDCPDKQARAEVKVLAYNTYLIAGRSIGELNYHRLQFHSSERVGKILKRVDDDYDIVGLQEVWTPPD